MNRRGPAGPHLDVSRRVAEALSAAAPVVALESTLVAHGLPWPLNVETVREMAGAIEHAGAVPALVAVLDGRIRIGLDAYDIERIARDDRIVKASAREIPVLLATGASGATTVAGTMLCARLAGIEVFATGGIGGVHRGAATTFDVSADLHELARTPVAVVCSGAKSILDVPATLEVLESLGVPVVGLGTDRFPAFHVRDSGLPAPHPARDAPEAARMVAAVLGLGRTGAVVANPVPAADAMDPVEVERLVREAEGRARAARIGGEALTPFLLRALADASGGATLRTNRALLVANARAAAEMARHLPAARSHPPDEEPGGVRNLSGRSAHPESPREPGTSAGVRSLSTRPAHPQR